MQRDSSGDFPAGETGDTNKEGYFLIENAGDDALRMYNPDGTFFQTITFPKFGSYKIRELKTQATWDWAVAWSGSGGDLASVTFVSRTVTVANSATVTLPLAGLTAVAVSNNERFIYYSGQGGSLNSEINVWDRNISAEISDLVADFGGTFFVIDILVMSNDDLVVLYHDASNATTIVRYNSSGVEQRRDTIGTGFTGSNPRLTGDNNVTDTSYWIMLHEAGVTTFRQYRLSDGVVISEIEAVEYSGGAFQPAVTATPGRYGVSPSCPVMITGPTPPVTTNKIYSCPALGGLHKIVPDKTDDTVWDNPIEETKTTAKIPNPTWKTGLVGE